MPDNQQVDPADFLRYTTSRRGALRAGAALTGSAAVAALLAACGGGGGGDNGGSFGGQSTDKPTSKASSTANKNTKISARAGAVSPTPREETVVVDQAVFTVFNSFNPFIPNGEQYNAGLGQVVREYLWYFNMPTGETIPWLATKWEYADDFKTFTIHLNPDAHWNDGKPFTSGDVLFTVNLLRKNAALLGRGPVTEEIKTISAPDANTVLIKLNRRDPRYHYNWICGIVSSFVIVPEHIWAGKKPDSFKFNPPVYTGPFKLQSTKPNLKMYVWEKDPNYWNKAKLDPKPKYVVYRSAPAADAEIQQFKDGACDTAGAANSYTLVKAAIDAGYQYGEITNIIDPCPRALWLNCDPSRAPMNDPRMRQAISALVDREKIATSIWPVKTTPATYPWPAFAGNDKWNVPALADKYVQNYDPAKAKSLLDDLGAKADSSGKRSYKGKPLSLEIITPVADPGSEFLIAQVLAKDLKAVGIDSSVRTLASAVYDAKTRKGQFDIRSEWLCGEVYDPWQVYNQFNDRYYVPVGKNSNEGNNVRLKDPAFTKSMDQLALLDPGSAAAKPLFEKSLQHYYEDLPVIATIQSVFTHQFNTTFWNGWPTTDNLYQVPASWWGQFLFVVGALQPTGAKVP
jgi:peptide/nickel transport system substrate-binding protein